MIYYLSIIISFTVTILGIVRYQKLTMPFKILTISFLVSSAAYLVNIYVNYKFKTNAVLSHIDAISNYLFYATVYYLLFKNKYTKLFILISVGTVVIFFFVNGIMFQPFLKVFPSNLNLPTLILYVIFALLLYKQMLLYPTQVNIIKQSTFWYNTAMLFFASTMFINLQLANYYSEHKIMNVIVYFWYIDNTIFDILLGIAILADKKELGKADA
jgi:hypothetical protein